MIRNLLIALLSSGLAVAQSSPTKPTTASAAVPGASPVSVETPVITIHGLCDASRTPAGATCETTVTRQEFEDLVNAIQPNMSAMARDQLATKYAAALVMTEKAHEMGIDETKKFQEKLQIARMQLTMQLLNDALTEKAANIPEKDIQDYYNRNLTSFEEADLQRIFVPRNKRQIPSKDKSYKEAPPQVEMAEMKKEAEQLRVRAIAGEDFEKLQEEAFKFADMVETPPSTEMKETRRSTLPGSQAIVFDLKQGEVSQVIPNMTGFLIYKLGPEHTLPLDQIRKEITENLKSQRLKDSIQALRQSAKAELNESYFTLPDNPMAEPLAAAKPASDPAPTNSTPIAPPPGMAPKESSY